MNTSNELFITKLAAAQRQLDTAIRLTFQCEDILAVHTVAAAAYNILRDLKRNRGKSELADSLAAGVYWTAWELVSGKIGELPSDILASKELTSFTQMVIDGIRAGKIRSSDDVKISMYSESSYWRKFNIPANFLKHADKDSGDLLSTDEVKNDFLILAACAAYVGLGAPLTWEMLAYYVYLKLENSEQYLRDIPETWRKRLDGVTGDARARICAELLKDMKRY